MELFLFFLALGLVAGLVYGIVVAVRAIREWIHHIQNTSIASKRYLLRIIKRLKEGGESFIVEHCKTDNEEDIKKLGSNDKFWSLVHWKEYKELRKKYTVDEFIAQLFEYQARRLMAIDTSSTKRIFNIFSHEYSRDTPEAEEAWKKSQEEWERNREKRELEQKKKAEEERKQRIIKQKEAEEARKKKEEEDKKNRLIYTINSRKEEAKKLHYFKIGQYQAAYCYDYYPKNRYPDMTSLPLEDYHNRNHIWAFKDGDCSWGVKPVLTFLDGNFSREEMKQMLFCVIPASNEQKNEKRYERFCETICAELPIQNGFYGIKINHPRQDSREYKSSNTIENLTFLDWFEGERVILFDDITTRGTSFIQTADAIMAKGAISVYGFFLGKTV